MTKYQALCCLLFFVAVFMLPAAPLHAADFQSWLVSLKREAAQAGVSDPTIRSALSDIQPIARVIELDRKQPESKITFAQYKKRVITQGRIDEGRQLMRRHSALLDEVSRAYGVPPQYIVALWGIETSYGKNTGGFDVIPALATLAHEGRRGDFFKAELINALKILDQGHISLAAMKGSWAGAMGQNQFMPSSFKAFAVDHDRDGRRDIWGTLPDVFASTANYLSKSGWQGDERWGRKVSLPRNFSHSLAGLDTRKSLAAWQSLGVRLHNGQDLPQAGNMQASIVLPDGPGGEAYLAYHNYRVIMKWNRSLYFATSVGLLADLIAKTS